MTDRTLSWALPEVTQNQAEIKHVEISFRSSPQFSWTVHPNPVVPPATEITFNDIAPGTIYYRAIVVDVLDQESVGVEIQATLDFDLPGDVSNLTVTDV